MVAEPKPAGPGPALKAAREAMNVEPREVADALNLPLSVVQAIEDNDYAQLPSAVFARGYVRSYAKLLELDPDPLVQEFPMPATSVSETNIVVSQPSAWSGLASKLQSVVRENQQIAMVVAAVLAGLLLILALVWLASDSPAEVDAATTDNAAQSPTAPVAAGLASGRGSSTPSVAAAAIETAADGSQVQRLNAGEDKINFAFSDECWLEIRSAAGEVLYSDLGQADVPLQFVGTGPFSILLGYAPSAEVRFNGEPVALAPHTRNNVATLVIGQ